MAFQDELRDSLVGLIPEEKKGDFDELMKSISDKMTKVFERSSVDIEDLKKKNRELEARIQTQTSTVPPNSEEYSKVLRQLEERDRQIEAKQKEVEDISTKFQGTAKHNKELEKLSKTLQEQLDKESRLLDETVKSSELRKAVSMLSFKDPSMSDEVFELLYGDVKVAPDDSGNRKAFAVMKGESGTDIPANLTDYVKNWAESSALAKSILAAPRSSGSGATGTGGFGSIGGPKTTEQLYQEAVASGNLVTQMALKAKMASEIK